MDQETAPTGPAETVVSKDPFAAAAAVFKATDGPPSERAETPEQTAERERDERGRFTAKEQAEAPGDEAEDFEDIEDGDAGQAETAPDDEVEFEDSEQEAEAAQPEPVAMPASWSQEHSETWNTLPPETQQVIAEREGQRDRAVNSKFQEAAELMRANQATIEEANANRQRFIQEAQWIESLVQLQEPDIRLIDQNPTEYHRQKAYFDAANQQLQALRSKRTEAEQAAAQQAQQQAQQQFMRIEEATRPKFFEVMPEAQDPQKVGPILNELIEYGVSQGAPADIFSEQTTSLEWTMLAKAKKWDDLQAAKAKAGKGKPEARKAGPAVRPGTKSAVSARKKTQAEKRRNELARDGSIRAGAAVFKDFMKG